MKKKVTSFLLELNYNEKVKNEVINLLIIFYTWFRKGYYYSDKLFSE